MRFAGASNVDPRIREYDHFMDTDFSRCVIPAKAGIQPAPAREVTRLHYGIYISVSDKSFQPGLTDSMS